MRSVWWGAESLDWTSSPARGTRGDGHAEALPQPPRYPRFGKFVIDPTSEDGRYMERVGKVWQQACSLCEMVESLTELDIFVRYPPQRDTSCKHPQVLTSIEDNTHTDESSTCLSGIVRGSGIASHRPLLT